MLFSILAVALMGGLAAAMARSFQGLAAIGAWLVLCLVACALGALALSSQPVGVATLAGRVGSLVVRWGFAAGRGRLLPAVAISWLAWAIFGTALIVALQHRSETQLQLLALAWAVDALALMYVCGIALARRSASMTRGLLPIAGALVGMLAVSAIQWSHPLLPGGRRTALLIAGGPPLYIGGAYGLFLLVMMTFGRRARWN